MKVDDTNSKELDFYRLRASCTDKLRKKCKTLFLEIPPMPLEFFPEVVHPLTRLRPSVACLNSAAPHCFAKRRPKAIDTLAATLARHHGAVMNTNSPGDSILRRLAWFALVAH